MAFFFLLLIYTSERTICLNFHDSMIFSGSPRFLFPFQFSFFSASFFFSFFFDNRLMNCQIRIIQSPITQVTEFESLLFSKRNGFSLPSFRLSWNPSSVTAEDRGLTRQYHGFLAIFDSNGTPVYQCVILTMVKPVKLTQRPGFVAVTEYIQVASVSICPSAWVKITILTTQHIWHRC